MAGNPDIQIVDTRSVIERFNGKIPGSVHISWKKFFKGKERVPLDREEFIALMKTKGINPEKPVVYYCTGGIRSAYAWSVQKINGFPNVKNYEGGMEAWDRRKVR
jgi:thiosulfate/3-mercaptopyruvate sulfurtransferase